jgi:uncharacterized membrane protein
MAADSRNGEFPTAAGIFLGLGLGGFFDGIVLHELLQWHHMASSAGYPPDSLGHRLIKAHPDSYGGEFDESKVVGVMFLEAGCDGSEMLDLAEEAALLPSWA